MISEQDHFPAPVRIFKGQNFVNKDVVWRFPGQEPDPYQGEWDELIDAIRHDKPYNECKRGAEASLVTTMGRMACHTGQIITFNDMLNNEHEFAPGLESLTMQSPAPLQAGTDGKYPVPEPGRNKREYGA